MQDVKAITILHLEDSPLDAELTAEMLASSGFPCEVRRVVHLEDFRRCLQEYAEHRDIDLILADYNMPEFDGLTALRMTRNVDPDLPFILLSGALGEELAVELLRSGATDYVLKNSMTRLSPVISRAIDEYRIKQRERASQSEIRQARDEAQKANNAKSRFLGRISHELRTPLNAIIGYTQLMQGDPMTEEQQHCSEQILKAGEHLLHLINEVLDITRIESGVIPITIKPTPLLPAIELSVDLVRPLARENNVCIAVDGGPEDLSVLADKDRLNQALINLITNAVKYNRSGGYIFVESDEEKPGYIKIFVRDTGIGIPPQKMERLFTPFDRLDLETSSTVPGTGLGLTVTKALVEAMGGTLGVVSSENEGSLFWVEIPAAPYEQQAAAGTDPGFPSSAAWQPLPNHERGRILVVENSEPVADFLDRAFRRRNRYQVEHANSLQQTREILATRPPDVILADLNLPDGQIEEILEHLLTTPGLEQIPVIIHTADVCNDRKERVMNMGSQAYFTKTVKMKTLFQEIELALKPEADGV